MCSSFWSNCDITFWSVLNTANFIVQLWMHFTAILLVLSSTDNCYFFFFTLMFLRFNVTIQTGFILSYLFLQVYSSRWVNYSVFWNKFWSTTIFKKIFMFLNCREWNFRLLKEFFFNTNFNKILSLVWQRDILNSTICLFICFLKHVQIIQTNFNSKYHLIIVFIPELYLHPVQC